MDGDSVPRHHVVEHATQPIVGDGGKQVWHQTELGAAESRGHRIAPERDRVIARDRLFVASREFVGEKGNVDIAWADEKRLHAIHCSSSLLHYLPAPLSKTPLCSHNRT